MEQNNPLFIAFQQGYARRNSNNFSRDWDEFKTNHADLFHPPSPAKPSVNGELLGFLEIEIEKANKNGKDCNLKDGDLNRAQAWYSAAEAFSIVKNKITELLNTPHGPQSNIINCPSCNTVWDLSRHNSCQCGATLVTKASPAKAEQEGPDKLPIYDLSALSEEDKQKFATDVMKASTGTLMATFYSLGLKSHLDQMSMNDANGDQFMLAFRKIVNDKLLGPSLPMAEREQEGLRWVKATMFNYKPNSRYYARWGDGDGAIKSTGWFQQSDGTFFWNENGFVPVLRKEHDQLSILDESTTSVKEAGQPISQDAHEKEVMMAAFDKVVEIFERRSWIMEGRGPYAYNDDEYRKEVSYLYDEWEVIRKDTWANIKSKSFEYRKQIIDNYLSESRQQPAEESALTAEDIDFMKECNVIPHSNLSAKIITENDEGAYLTKDDLLQLSDILYRYAKAGDQSQNNKP